MFRDYSRLKGKRGAALVRVSSGKQDCDRQKEELLKFATVHALTILKVYEDTRSRLSVHKAADFEKMMATVEKGEYDFILILSQNRFGVKHDFEFATFCNDLLNAGVELWDTVNGLLNDPEDFGGRITTTAHNFASSKEITEKAYHTITGKVHKITKAGTTFFGGHVPFGCAVAVFSSSGQLRFKVEKLGKSHFRKIYPSGHTEERHGSFPASDNDDIPRLCWSSIPGRVELVKNLFNWFGNETWSLNGLARKMMTLEVNYSSEAWQPVQIRRLLSNPVYVGKPTWNRGGGAAKKWEYIGGEYRPVAWKFNRPQATKNRTAADLVPAIAHECLPPLISDELFEKVNKKLEVVAKKPAPKSEALWLAGLVVCAGCGERMSGQKGDPKHRKSDQFICSTYHHKGKGNKCGCWKNAVKHRQLEGMVTDYLEDCGRDAQALIAGTDTETLSPLLRRLASQQRTWQQHWERLVKFNRDNLPDGKHRLDMPYNVWDGDDILNTIPVEVEKDGDDITFSEDFGELELFRALWTNENVRVVNERAGLERRREELYERMKGYTSAYARKRADEEMDELSGRIDSLNAELERHDVAFREASSELHELAAKVERARKELGTNDNRRRADAVRQVVSRIVCHFAKDETATSQKPSTTLEKVEIWLVGSDDDGCGTSVTVHARSNAVSALFFRLVFVG